MAFGAKFYDPDQVVIYFAGVLVQGFADGEFITTEQLADAFTDVVGSDGEVARSKSNDRRATVTIKLLQSSASNALLSAVHKSDLNTPNGAGVGTFLMQDLQGGTIVKSDQAWIVKYPDGSMDRSAKSREWQIRLATVDRAEGGN
jgi:hypothetical protein